VPAIRGIAAASNMRLIGDAIHVWSIGFGIPIVKEKGWLRHVNRTKIESRGSSQYDVNYIAESTTASGFLRLI
jgi:hypothetical protein